MRLLHTVATTPGGITVGALTELLGISQSTCSHHVRKLADVGFLKLHKEGTSTRVTVNQACCVGLPHAADAVMGLLAPRPCCPEDVPADVTVRALAPGDWPAVRRIYAEGIATGIATFETTVPSRASWTRNGYRTTAGSPSSTARSSAGPPCPPSPPASATPASPKAPSTSPTATAAEASAKPSSANKSSPPTKPASGPCKPPSSPRTAPASPCTTPPATAPSASANASPNCNGTWHDTVLIERRADTVTCPG